MIYREACRALGVSPEWSPEALLPEPAVPELHPDPSTPALEALLHDVVRRIYDIEADDRALRASAHDDASQRAKAFDQLRTMYPVRREFRFTRLAAAGLTASRRAALSGLGLSLS